MPFVFGKARALTEVAFNRQVGNRESGDVHEQIQKSAIYGIIAMFIFLAVIIILLVKH